MHILLRQMVVYFSHARQYLARASASQDSGRHLGRVHLVIAILLTTFFYCLLYAVQKCLDCILTTNWHSTTTQITAVFNINRQALCDSRQSSCLQRLGQTAQCSSKLRRPQNPLQHFDFLLVVDRLHSHLGRLGIRVDLVDIFDFGLEQERRSRELCAEGIDESRGGLFDGGNSVRGPKKVQEGGKRLAGCGLRPGASAATLEGIDEVLDQSGDVARWCTTASALAWCTRKQQKKAKQKINRGVVAWRRTTPPKCIFGLLVQ
jgi:hypothetical protein